MVSTNSQRFNYKAKPERVEIVTEGLKGTPSVEVPFIMGVMADLSGASNSELPDVEAREFSGQVDADTFDAFLKSQRPRVQFNVASSLVKGQDLAVDITFEKMDDFLPNRVAEKVPGLKELLELRRHLQDLQTFASKAKIRKMIEKFAGDQDLLREFASALPRE